MGFSSNFSKDRGMPMTGRASYARSNRKTQYDRKQRIKETRQAMNDVIEKTQGPVTRLLGDQTSDFTLKGLTSATGTKGGTDYVITVENDDGTTLYIDAGTSYS